MEIDEYRIEFLNTIRNEASLDGNDVDDQFVNTVLSQLEEMGESTFETIKIPMVQDVNYLN